MSSERQILLEKITEQYILTGRSSLPRSISTFSFDTSSSLDLISQQTSHLDQQKKLNLPTVFPDALDSQDWPALAKWSPDYFSVVMGEQEVTVAVTPDGRADAIANGVFAQPLQERKKLKNVMKWMAQCNSLENKQASKEEVWYLQLQNGSLDLEYQTVKTDLPALGLPFASPLSGPRPPSSDQDPGPLVNMWIGNSRSSTSLHHDPFENLYCQVLGSKTVTLYPPHEWYHLNEIEVPTATYQRSTSGELELISDSGTIRWLDSARELREAQGCRGYTVTLNPGDCLYLPALWYHEVTQNCAQDTICVSINYWYDMDYLGTVWRDEKLMRKIGLMARGLDDVAARELEEEEAGL